MQAPDIDAAVSSALTGRRLLDHPYYRAWQEGSLSMPDLAEYAAQYRHFEAALPEVLAGVVSGLSSGAARDLVESNLSEETSEPEPHLDLFERFATSVGAPEAAPSPATAALVGLYHRGTEAGPLAALSVIAAYETQAAAIASTKAGALAGHYGLGPEGTEFWSVHATLEDRHAEWTSAALAGLEADPAEVAGWARRSAESWWAFLDERELARAG